MGGASSNYFSWDNINEIAGIDSHLEFASSLIEKYSWSDEVRRSFEASLEQIRAKQRDKQLNISVVGEFSTGKSTFLNAILGAELLTSAALQGTTLATTVIEYGKELRISAKHVSGRTDTNFFQNMEELRRRLSAVTTDASEARRCDSVTVTLPSANLSQGFRFIDTPGTNALESWHEDVTVRALRELSDLSVVLVNAIQPLPDSLCRFISDNLSDVLGNCVFVVTKIDLVPKAEREMILRYISQKLKNTFELSDALVIPYVSTQVLADRLGEGTGDTELLKLSYDGEARLFGLAARQRAASQARKLLTLIDRMYLDISKQMGSMSEGYKSELAELLRTRQTDLSEFVERQVVERGMSFDRACSGLRAQTLDFYQTSAEEARKAVMSDIEGKSSIDSLCTYVENNLTSECNRRAGEISGTFKQKAEELNGLFKEEMRIFRSGFEKNFHDLQALDVRIPKRATQLTIPDVSAAGFKGGTQYIKSEQKKENHSYFFWMVAGVIIGSIIAPVIGTAIGFVVGCLLGAKFSPKTETVRSVSAGQLALPVREYFTTVTDTMTQSFDNYRNKLKSTMQNEIRRYSKQYNDIVQRRIAEEESKRQSIEGNIAALRHDMDAIDMRKEQLNNVVKQIDKKEGKI